MTRAIAQASARRAPWWLGLALAGLTGAAYAQVPGEGQGPPPDGDEGPPAFDEGEGAPAFDEGEGAPAGGEPAYEGEGEADDTPEPPPPRAVDPDVAQDGAAAARREELGKSAYTFCHDDDFEPSGPYGDKRFCKTWDARALEACPRAKEMCLERISAAPWRLELPPWLGWTLLTAVLAVVLFFFVRALLGKDWSSTDDLDLGDVVDDALAGELQALPEAPSQVILRKAAEALAAGRVEEAAVLVQLACLRYFDDTGLVSFHPSRTNGEYLRALRRRSAPHHALYRGITAETDRVRFGGGSADRTAVEACLATARTALATPPPPDPLAAPAALLLLLALTSGLGSGCGDNDKPFYSHRPAGMAALPAVLRSVGLEVEVGRRKLAELDPNVAVVVLESSVPRDLDELGLDDVLDRGVTVLVLDDAHKAAELLPLRTSSASAVVVLPGLGGTLNLGPESPPAETVFVNDDWLCGADLSRIDARLHGRITLPRGERLLERDLPEGATATTAVSAHGWLTVPVLLVEDGPRDMASRAVAGVRIDKELGYARAGCLMVFSEGDLFSNASLAVPPNAEFVAALFAALTPEHHKIVLLDGLRDGGAADAGIARSVQDSKLLPLIAHGLLWVAVLFMSLGFAFGPLRDPVVVRHKAFVEHVEALGRQYARLGGPGLTHVARSLGKYLVMRHRAEVRGGSANGWTTVAQNLADKHGLPPEDVSAAFRLGLEGVPELGPPVSDEVARSEPVLRALSVLITGRARTVGDKNKRARGR